MADEVKSESEKKKEDWMNSKWRPMMGWIYMLTCITDFILFPILWSILQAVMKQPVTAWQPITLQGAGLFHLSMGAIIGVAAFGRTQEKLAGANNGGIQTPGSGFAGGPSTFGQPQSGGFGQSSSFNSPAPVSSGFGGNSGFGAPAAPTSGGFGGGFNSSPAQVVTGFGGKPAPAQEPQPLL
jgi:hypothetical protein